MNVKAATLIAVCSFVFGCESHDSDAVESNDLGITEIQVRHDVVQNDRLLTVIGFDQTGATVATAVLRTGMVKYGADMPEDLHAGTELKLTVGDATASFVDPDRVPHVIDQPLSDRIATFVGLHAVATEIDREAGIQFAPPQPSGPDGEIALWVQACASGRFPTAKGGASQCCQVGKNTYHVNATNAVVNRYTYAPAWPQIPVCRKADGTTGCTTNCLYGPCGAAIGTIAGTNGHVFHVPTDGSVCGWDNGGPGGLNVDYAPEHYTTQTLFGSVTASCGCTGCNADGTAICSSFQIGETSIVPIDDTHSAGWVTVQQTFLQQAATIQSLSFYVTTAAGSVRLGIYDATGPSGGPGAKKAETASITATTGWNMASVTPVSLPAGTYWLAHEVSDNALHYPIQSEGPYKYQALTYGPMPATFSTSPLSGTGHWSLYATMTP